jgi:flagellar hook protein FlgE
MYGMFTSPTLGMLAQTAAFGSISQNISNMNTGGYKGHDTRFSTIMENTGGLISNTRNIIEQQGNIISSKNNMDLAVTGKGFYVLNTAEDTTGDTLYTRDGAFEIKSGTQAVDADGNTFNEGHIVDKNGYYLQGWVADTSGKITAATQTQSLRIDTQAFNTGGAADAAATKEASLSANLPVTTKVGGVETTNASYYDATGNQATYQINWTKGTTPLQWNMTVSPDSGTSASTGTFTFDSNGGLPDNTTTAISITNAAGATTTFNLDISEMTSFGNEFFYGGFTKDGHAAGELDNFNFDKTGKIIGTFSNGLTRTLYKLPLATFVNGDGLNQLKGNIFQESINSGQATLREVKTEQDAVGVVYEFASFIPFAQELGNIDLQDQFTSMIMSQQAYNSSSMVFKSLDEMLQMAAKLKS